jgi:hypothetical protein
MRTFTFKGALGQAGGIVEKLETDRVVILSEAKNLHMNQADSSVATLPQNDRVGFFNKS